MRFETLGEKGRPAVLFFHAMGVVGESSEPVAQFLRERYFCVMPTSSVYCAGERYVSKEDEIRQVEDFLRAQGVRELALVVSSSLGADLALAFLAPLALAVVHSVVGMKAANDVIAMAGTLNAGESTAVTAALLLVVYGGYFLATALACRRMAVRDN